MTHPQLQLELELQDVLDQLTERGQLEWQLAVERARNHALTRTLNQGDTPWPDDDAPPDADADAPQLATREPDDSAGGADS